MASLNREQMIEIFQHLREEYLYTDSEETRAEVKKLAVYIESCIGQQERIPASEWSLT